MVSGIVLGLGIVCGLLTSWLAGFLVADAEQESPRADSRGPEPDQNADYF